MCSSGQKHEFNQTRTTDLYLSGEFTDDMKCIRITPKIRHQIDCMVLVLYGTDDNFEITEDLLMCARRFLMLLYNGQ